MKVIQLKMMFRGWMRNKVYTVISILSLTVGLVCSVLMAGFITNEYQIANVISDNDQWYSFKSKSEFYGDSEREILGSVGTGSVGGLLQSRFPEVTDFCVFHSCVAKINKEGRKVSTNGFFEVTANMGKLCKPRLLGGDLRQTLSRPGEIAVTRSFALSTFGRDNVIGEPLRFDISKAVRVDNGLYTKFFDETYTITAVIDDSERGFFNYKVLKGLPEKEIDVNLKSWQGFYYTFVQLDRDVVGKDFEKKMRADSAFHELRLVPLKEIYFTPGSGADDDLTLSRSPVLMYVGISIALAVLIIACFNYINLGMTRTLQRLRNTGQQMIFGASKQQMRMHLMVETGVQTFLALGMALLLIWKLLPPFNALFESRLIMPDFFSGITPWLLSVILLAMILFPSLYIFSRLGEDQLSRILKQEYSRGPRLVTSMVVAQFAVSIVLLLFVVNVHRQIDFIAHNRPGAESILLLDEGESTDEQAWEVFCEKLNTIPEIEKITKGSGLAEGAVSTNGRFVSMINCDENYFNFYNLQFVAGGPFTAHSPKGSVVVNETFVKKWNLKEPVGYSFDFNGGNHTICGVVHDFIIEGLTRTITPLMIIPEYAWISVVKVAPENQKAAVGKMMALWKEVAPDQPLFNWETMSDAYLAFHREEQKMMRMVSAFAWISLILTCLGLFGLAWYSVENRMKEIALRKVNGATESQVIGLLCNRFMKWIMIAFLIALPIAFYFTQEWIEQFIYRQEATVWNYIGVGIFALGIGVLTVIWQSWRAAVRNPVETLKRE